MTPAHEMDISWTVLRQIARNWQGDRAELAEVTPLVGGCVNTTLGLTMKDGLKAVLKICAHRVNLTYAHEAFQLEKLRALGLPVPEVYAWKVGSLDDSYSYILIEHLQGINLTKARRLCTEEQFEQLQNHLAELVLTLHNQTSDGYGRLHANAPRLESWITFFRELYDTMLQDVGKSALLSHRCRKQLRRIHERLERIFVDLDPPRLVHGDLWGTNILANANGDSQWHISGILDPNCKYAHAEMELAYLELFRTATPTFFKSYQRHQKLPPEYHRLRKHVYQLYSLVNHVQVFGQEYVKPLNESAERITALM